MGYLGTIEIAKDLLEEIPGLVSQVDAKCTEAQQLLREQFEERNKHVDEVCRSLATWIQEVYEESHVRSQAWVDGLEKAAEQLTAAGVES